MHTSSILRRRLALRPAVILLGLAAGLLPVSSFAAGKPAPAQVATAPTALATDRRIDVAMGSQEIIDTGRTPTRIAVGKPEIADVALLKSGQLRVLGMKPGVTDVVVWTASGRTTLEITVTGNLAALRRAAQGDAELANIAVDSEGGRTVLRGRVAGSEAHRRLLSIAKTQGDEPVVDMTQVEGDQVVAVEVKFAAVSTRTLRSLGFDFRKLGTKWQFATSTPGNLRSYSFTPQTSPDARFTPGTDGLSAVISPAIGNAFNLLLGFAPNNILAGISALAATDLAQVLAEPTLLVRSGESANFIAGGEIPVPVPQGGVSNSVTIDYKPFGVRLDVSAVVLSQDRIVLRVSPEVSELDYTNALTIQGFNIPAIRKRATSTTVELGDGQSFVLAGLTYTTNGNTDERLPGLGDIPILGAIFKRTNSSREAQELIIVATPRLVRAVDPRSMPELPGAKMRTYAPTTTDMLLGRNTADDAIGRFGLMR